MELADDRITAVTMPKWGLAMEVGKIVAWLVDEGAQVAKGDELVDVETEKIAGAVESPGEGVLRRRIAEVGESLPVGAVLAVIAPAAVTDAEIDAFVTAARDEIADLTERGAAAATGPAPEVLEVSGRRVSHLTLGADHGSAEPVVLVHGYGGDKNSWLFVHQPLAQDRTVHAVDLLGHGDSDKEVPEGGLAALAAALLAYLDAVGVRRAHLVGHSLGGAIVAAVADTAPARVASLTLIAPAGVGDRVDAGYLRDFAAATSRKELKPLLGRLFAADDVVTRQFVDDVLRYKRMDGVRAALDRMLQVLLGDDDRQALDIRPILSAVSVPVTIVWGAGDRILPPPDGDPPRRLVVIDSAGHMPQMESPSAVTSAIKEQLAG